MKKSRAWKSASAWLLIASMVIGLFAGFQPVKSSDAKAAAETVNLAAGKSAYASSCQGSGSDGEKVVDDDTTTRWESAWSEAESWVYVDLGAEKAFTSLEFLWEGAYATSYEVFTSNDEMNWTSIYKETASDGGTDTIQISGNARFVKLVGYTKSLAAYGYSMYEFRVFGEGELGETYDYGEDLAYGKTAYGSSVLQEWWLYNEDVTATTHVTDGDTIGTRIMDGAVVSSNAKTRWWSDRNASQWLYVDLERSYTIGKVEIDWSDCSGRIFDIQVSNDAQNWTTVYRAVNNMSENTSVPMYAQGRYVRMLGHSVNKTNGYCVYSMRVYGYPEGAPKPVYNIEALPESYVGEADTGLGTYLANDYAFVQATYPAYTAEGLEAPIESNGWWQNMLIYRYSNALCTLPMKMQYSAKGLGIWTATEGWANGGSVTVESTVDFYLMPEGMEATSTRTEVSGYSDFAVTVDYRDDAHIGMTTTIVKGSPYTYTEFGSVTEAYLYSTAITKIFDNAGNAILTESGVSYIGDHIGLEITDSDNETGTYGSTYYYCINVPEGTRFLRVGNKIKITFPGTNGYVSTATMKSASDLNYYYQHGYAFVTDTDVSYTFNEATAEVEVVYSLATEVKRAGFSNVTFINLLPHQYKISDTPLTDIVYSSVRGDMKLCEGNSFTTRDTFYGIVPQFTKPTNPEYNNELMIEYLDTLVESTNGNLMSADAYWQGKTAHPLAMGLLAADQLGLTSYEKVFIKRLKVIFEDWFTYSGEDDECFLYYDPIWGTLYYEVSEFGANTGITDHHFTYGYFTFAATVLATYDEEFYNEYGSMIDLLIRDYANYSDSDDMFCQFRNFDPYEGHSWAGGYADNDSGNNQEAAGESLFGWVGAYLWAVKSGNKTVRDAAIYGFTTELYAIENYWFNFDQDIWLEDWQWHGIGQVYGSTYFFGTFFHGDPVYIYGIHWLPTSEYITYYGMDQAGIRRLYEGLETDVAVRQAEADAAGQGYHVSTPDEAWQHINWTILSLYDPAAALGKWAADNSGVQANEKYNAYWFINNMASLGVRSTNVWATGGASATVYEKNGKYTAIVWNPTSEEVTINFRNAGGVVGSATVAPTALGSVDPFAATKVEVPVETEEPYVDPLEGITVGNDNLALKKNATASSTEAANTAAQAVDGDLSTRWSSNTTDDEWFMVDLGAEYKVCLININWEAAYASSHVIEVSKDGQNWITAYTTKKCYGGEEEIRFAPIEARYVRFQGTGRKTAYGYSFYEFEVYGAVDGTVTPEPTDPTIPSESESESESESTAPSESETEPTNPSEPSTPGIPGNVNIALDKKVFASGYEDASAVTENVNDGDLATRWASNFAGDAYVYVDLYATYDVCKVVVNWEAAYAKQYSIDVSTDGVNWTTVHKDTAGNGGVDTIEFAAVPARYVRMQGIERFMADFGYSIYELEVYATADSYAEIGDVEDTEGVNLALNKEASASSAVTDPNYAVDGNQGSRWESDMADPQWWSVDLGKKYNLESMVIVWETACSKAYTIQVSDDGTAWTTVYTQNNGQGGTETINLTDVAGRYVKLESTERATVWGNSFYEFEVYGSTYKEESIPSESESESESETESTPDEPVVVSPAQVTGVQAAYADGKIVLTWDDCGAVMYKVSRTDGRNGYTTLTYSATAAGYTDTQVVDAQLYYYRITGYFRDADGNLVSGEISDAAGVVATDKLPDKITGVTATLNGSHVTLQWDAASGARYYKVSRAAGATGKYYSVKYNLETTSYTDTGLSAGTYRYKVVGYYKDVDSSWVYGELCDTLYVTVK